MIRWAPILLAALVPAGCWQFPSELLQEDSGCADATSTRDLNVSPDTVQPDASADTDSTPPRAWFDERWSFRKKITIAKSLVASARGTHLTLLDFPLLVAVDDSDLKQKALPSGLDLVFTEQDGQTVPDYEVEQWRPEIGRLIAWVRLAQLSSQQDTVLYLYYGSSSAAQGHADPEKVWGTDHAMVLHMDDDPVTSAPQLLDSTANANHGTLSTTDFTTVGTGQVGLAWCTKSTTVAVPHHSSLDLRGSLTLSLWVKNDTFPLGNILIGKTYGFGSSSFTYALSSSFAFSLRLGSSVTSLQNNNPNDGERHHVAAVYDAERGRMTLTFDGGLRKVKDVSGDLKFGDGALGLIGTFAGCIDELRISGVARALEWVETSYKNQKDPSAFQTLGPRESF